MARKDITDKMVCEACRDSSGVSFHPSALHLLVERSHEAPKVCLAAMERAHARGLIGCGVSIRCSWLTTKGTALLTSDQVEVR